MTGSRTDKDFLDIALQVASKYQGFCAPNPAVGAVLVRDGEVIATGAHTGAGNPHAEVEALCGLEEAAQGATLYVTLEPCCHYGRTPPCTDLIIRSGIARVVFAFKDPYPKVAGAGQQQLLDAGIDCQRLDHAAINAFYTSYAYWLKHQQPFVTAKLAVSQDNKVAAAGYQPVAITGPECQEFTHQHRYRTDAILTTSRTITCDDPSLNARLSSTEVVAKPLFILDARLELPLYARVFETAKSLTVFHQAGLESNMLKPLVDRGVQCIALSAESGQLNLHQVLSEIGKAGMHDLWVEAGPRCFMAFLSQGLLQKAYLYRSPLQLGADAISAQIDGDAIAQEASSVVRHQLGDDLVTEFTWAF